VSDAGETGEKVRVEKTDLGGAAEGVIEYWRRDVRGTDDCVDIRIKGTAIPRYFGIEK